MIASLQKSRLLARLLLARLKDGQFPDAYDALQDAEDAMEGLAFGLPLTRVRAAVPGQPIGGKDGKDLERTFAELHGDLSLLYTAQIQSAVRTVDIYDLFAVRRDALALRMNQLRVNVGTMLAQVSAGRRDSVHDSFNNLDLTDAERTTATVDLDEGTVSLSPDAANSVRYDGTRVRVVRHLVPQGGRQLSGFKDCFSPYRGDAWYAQLPPGSEYVAYVDVTGADYQAGATEEVELNAIRIDPTGPLTIKIEWSPDGYNWHALSPAPNETIRDRRTFHFETVRVGYLRFGIRPVETAGLAPGNVPVGIKRIEFMVRGFDTEAQFFSVQHLFDYPVSTVVAELDSEIPVGTKLEAYVSQDYDGPWMPIGDGPVAFDTVLWKEIPLETWERETTDETAPAMFWKVGLPSGDLPLPETGELIVGRDRLELSAFPFDWGIRQERDHIPLREDWAEPLGEVRAGVFQPLGEWDTPAITDTVFTDEKNPLAVDNRQVSDLGDSLSYLTVCLKGADGEWCLQPGYNYRLRAWIWCETAITLEEQRIGVLNPDPDGLGKVVAPLSVYLNEEKVFERTFAAESVEGLTASFQMTLPFQQGWNEFELLLQLPRDLTTLAGAAGSGIAGENLFLYFQPNLFHPNRVQDFKIEKMGAQKDPWRQVSEFELRYNVPIQNGAAWAWKLKDDGSVDYVLFNHNPLNDAASSGPQWSIDGVNIGRLDAFTLRYAVERVAANSRSLYFRADLSRDPKTPAPPVLRSYRLIVN